MAIKGSGDYAVEYQPIPLEDVAGKTRVMEDEFINPQGTGLTDAVRKYLRPLLGANLPDAHRLRAAAVAKILN